MGEFGTRFLSVDASSGVEDAHTFSDMEAAMQGLHCSSGNKMAILMSEKG